MIYVIIKVSFDNSENHIGNAIYKEIIGTTLDEQVAIRECENLEKSTKKYKGWDGDFYPYYKYTTTRLIK